MKLKRKGKLLVLGVIACIALLVGVVIAQVYWRRSVTLQFDVKGISAELLQVGYENYRTKNIATSLDSNNQAVISIYSEQFYVIALNCTFTSNATGLIMNCTGQYLRYYWGSGSGVIETIGSPFNISGFNVVDKAQMQYRDPGFQAGGQIGYGMLITVAPWLEYVTIPGFYQAVVTLELGFV